MSPERTRRVPGALGDRGLGARVGSSQLGARNPGVGVCPCHGGPGAGRLPAWLAWPLVLRRAGQGGEWRTYVPSLRERAFWKVLVGTSEVVRTSQWLQVQFAPITSFRLRGNRRRPGVCDHGPCGSSPVRGRKPTPAPEKGQNGCSVWWGGLGEGGLERELGGRTRAAARGEVGRGWNSEISLALRGLICKKCCSVLGGGGLHLQVQVHR